MEKLRYWIILAFEPINLVLSAAASLLRPWAYFAPDKAITPEKPIRLYEFESCPSCRIAREAVSGIGLEVEICPCPNGGQRYRPWVKERGGKSQFPYLVDENTGTEMYESADIVRYLARTYGNGTPWWLWLGPIGDLLSAFSSLLRPVWGDHKRRSSPPEKLLVFEGSEGSPFARTVRELLCEMEIAYRWQPKAGKPKLNDPNTDHELLGDFAIRRYLIAAYGGGARETTTSKP